MAKKNQIRGGRPNGRYNKRNNSHNTKNSDNGQQLFDSEGDSEMDDKGYRGRKGRKSAKNDPSWYSTNKSLIESTANIPFNQISGLNLDIDWNSFPTTNITLPTGWNYEKINIGTSQYRSNMLSGIMALDIVPSVGFAEDPSDPLNMSALAMFSYIRHANSGTAYGDPADTMIFMLAMSQVYSAINWLQRIYGTVSLYSQQNRYFPVGLAYAQHVDFNDVAQNMADFRYGINLLINKAAAFAVPNSFTYFQRSAFLYSNYYIDGESMRDQIYILNPLGFWFYQEGVGSEAAGMLKFRRILDFLSPGNTRLTHTNLINIVNTMISSLLGSEDIGILSGNILKAFGDGNLVKLAPLPEDYTILPVYDIGVLEQIHNATNLSVAGVSAPSELNNDITQIVTINNGAIQYKPTISYSFNSTGALNGGDRNSLMSVVASNLNSSKLLLTGNSNPSISDIIENTRLKVGYEPKIGLNGISNTPPVNEVAVKLTLGLHPASDYIFGVRVITSSLTSTTQLGTGFISTDVPGLIIGSTSPNFSIALPTTMYQALSLLTRIAIFDFRPEVRMFVIQGDGTSDNTNIQFVGRDVEIANYTVMNNENLNRLTDACLVNEFYVPSVGSL